MKVAAGLLMFKKDPDLQVFLVHFGGPFWAKKDNGAWSIAKGLQEGNEGLMETAKREFSEETGIVLLPANVYEDLGTVSYHDKIVYCWAFEGDLPNDFVFKSNLTEQGWPEKDKGQFFPIDKAKLKILPAQKVFLERLASSF